MFAAVSAYRATENAASPTTLSAINGILVLIFRNVALRADGLKLLVAAVIVPGAAVIVIVSTGSRGFPGQLDDAHPRAGTIGKEDQAAIVDFNVAGVDSADWLLLG